ncbi:kinase-like protein [Suillus brevipes Sb2]|nr:kinase-like protein [Suillus brevipes Sb2]
MENLDDVRTKDLPDDLTPFITRTTPYPVSGGGYGDVWQCNYNRVSESALVAVKAFKLPERYDLEAINRKISREIGILKIVLHKNIVPLLGIATGFGRMSELRCLVSPWMPNGTLNVYLASNHNDLTILDRARLLEDVSAGLRYLHSIPVMHGDITGANILIDKGGHARLIDFGLSTITQPLLGQSHLAATSIRPGAIRYAAPELVLSEHVRATGLVEKTDIYSFGCVMLQILSGLPPWSEITSERPEFRIVVMISEGRRPQRPNCHPKIVDSDWNFIQKCLQSGPELRPSADEVLNFVVHRFYSPDSCSRPPDDPSDDTPDNFPGASPYHGYNDTAEQPPDSQPVPSDYKLKTLTLITVADNLSASTSSTPAISVPALFSYNDTGVSNTSEPTDHSLEEFQCMWEGPNGLSCNDRIHDCDFRSHLRILHGMIGPGNSIVPCRWHGCNMTLRKDCLWRHVKEKHLGIRRGGGKSG